MSDTPTAAPIAAGFENLERDDPAAVLRAFETDDSGLHLRAAQWIRRYIESEGLGEDTYLSLVGEFRENIECLEAQNIRRYETMFLGRHPENGTPLDQTQRWVWNHRGQVSPAAKARIRELVAKLPDQVEICEVGSFIGRGSTRAFVDAFRTLGKSGRIFCVDPWTPEVYREYFEANMRQFGAEDLVTAVQKTSTMASLDFEDGRFDLVYLDGLHDYRAVMSDLCKWFPKVKPGGIISGDDCEGPMSQCIPAQVLEYCHLDCHADLVIYEGDGRVRRGGHPGVIRAVDEFFHGRASIGASPENQWWVEKGAVAS